MKLVKIISSALLVAVLFTNCKQVSDDPFSSGFNAFDDGLGARVEAYQMAGQPDKNNAKQEKRSLYIDFSSGISQALLVNENKAALNAICGKLLGNGMDGINVFKLSRDAIQPFEVTDPTLVAKQVEVNAKFNDVYVPIRKAVREIVEKNSDAVLVTDFEEYDATDRTEITTFPYLTESFVKWLSKGNSIHFFIADYNEVNPKTKKIQSKHLFFTIFNYGKTTSSSILPGIEEPLKKLTKFDLSNRPYTLSQNYEGDKLGGVFYDNEAKTAKEKDVLLLNGERYINGLKKSNSNFEFYPFGNSWENIAQAKKDYGAQFNDFFRKLFADLENEDAYRVEDMTVKVTDVTNDFEQFAKCSEAARHRPHLAKGNNGENVFDKNEKDPIALECYNTDGTLKKQWIYDSTTVVKGPVINELFAFNEKLFTNNLKDSNKRKVELAVSFDNKFNSKNIPASSRLLRVDILVDKVTPSTAEEKLSKFGWSTGNDKKNTALATSIANTLSDPKVKPDQQVVYSYYITTIK